MPVYLDCQKGHGWHVHCLCTDCNLPVQVIAIAAEHFTDSSLRHHILHVLTSQLPAAEQPALHAEAAATGKKHELKVLS